MGQIGQSTIEYLVIMAIVIVIGLLVVGTASSFFDSSSSISNITNKINVASGTISISEIAVDDDGDLIGVFQNNSGELLTITSIGVGDDNGTLNENWPSGSTKNIYLEDIEACACDTPGETKICELTIALTNRYGRSYFESITVQVDCVGDSNSGDPVVTPTQPVYLSSCTTISSSGTYILSNDISSIDQNCFTITANDVILNGNSKTISYTNNGSATFASKELSTEIDDTHGLGVGDFDGDGDLDYIAGNNGAANRLYINDGSASFSLEYSTLDSDSTYAIGVGDLDNDNDLDFIAGNYNSQINRVYLNDGSGNFSNDWNSTETDITRGLALGDFDGDGDLDYVAGNSGHANRVYLNDGSGSFTLHDSSSESDYTQEVSVVDFDGDGDLDYVSYSDRSSPTPVFPNRVYLNDGYGDFSLEWSSGDYDYRKTGVAGDFDGDGDYDFFSAAQVTPNYLTWNDGSASFTNSSFSDESTYTYGSAIGDFDGDDDIDILLGNTASNYWGYDRIYLNNGSGSFSSGWNHSLGDGTYALGVGDFDGDGDFDYIAGNGNYGVALKQNSVNLNISDNETDNNYSYGVVASGVSGLSIYNLNINYFSTGVLVNNVSDTNISNSSISRASINGIEFSNSSSANNIFENNSVYGYLNGLKIESISNATFNGNNFCSEMSVGNGGSSRMDIYCYNESSLSGSDNNANMNNGCSGFSWNACQ